MSSSAPVVHLEDYASRRATRERHAGAGPSAGAGAATVAGRTRSAVPMIRRRQPRPRVVRSCGREPAGRRDAEIELTRRGWAALAIVAVMLVAFGLLGANAWSSRGVAEMPSPGGSVSHSTTTVTVQPGQTLWEIAGRVAAGGDVRATVDRIAELNGLTSAGDVQAGQRLLVPALGHQ